MLSVCVDIDHPLRVCVPGARPQRSNGCAAVAAAPAPRRAAVNLRPAVACAASAVEEHCKIDDRQICETS